mmetsp:Transcript_46027/g.144790  ORF Transcript_46027/g.144790 Transcript_46027/m.144790 type:complete len:536 (-) Transcript_46027:86-1693(-)
MCRTIPRATRHRTHVGASRRKAMGIRGEIVKIRGETERGSADGPRTVGPARRPRAWRRDPARRPAEYAVYGSTRKRWVSLWRGSEVGARVDGAIPELLLDAQQLVVLCEPLGPARRTRLDLSRLEADGEVGDEGVLRLAGAVGRHHAPARLLCHVDRLDRLGDGADLVHLEQQRVGRAVLDRARDLGRVRDREVVADDLHVLPVLCNHLGPVLPIVLVKTILDGDDGEVLDEAAVELHQFRARDLLRRRVPHAQVVQRVLARRAVLDLELGGGHVEADSALALVARLVDGLHHQLDAGARVARRREAALVSDQRGVAAELLLEDLCKVVVDLGADEHALLEGGCAGRDDKVLLERQLVARVRASVDHVEAGHRHHQLAVAGQVGEVAVERHALGCGSRLGGRERHAQDGVGSDGALVCGAVEAIHLCVNRRLVRRVHPDKLRGEHLVHVVDRREHALPHVPVAAVAQLDRLVGACRSAARHRRPRQHASRDKVHLDRRIAARVVDLARLDRLDCHCGVGGTGNNCMHRRARDAHG